MRFIFTFCLSFCFFLLASAQVHETPLTENQILQQKNYKEQTAFYSPEELDKLQYFVQKRNIENSYYVNSGKSLRVCVDTIKRGGNVFSLETTASNFGTITNLTAAGKQDSTCITYQAKAGVKIGRDTVTIKLCKKQNACELLQYVFIVRRPNDTLTLAAINLKSEELRNNICVNAANLPGTLAFGKFVECYSPHIGEAKISKNTPLPTTCFSYQATRLGGIDTICYQVCDDLQVCDLYKIPIKVASDTIGLPFLDDFSYNSVYPSSTFWLDKNVYINTTMGINAPSVGVATFDGLDAKGKSYLGKADVSDYLTSRYIDLGKEGNANLFLTFFIEPKGRGDAPEAADSLILEYKNKNNTWSTISRFSSTGMPTDSFRVFAYPIPNAFKYKGFQFRFKNYSKRSGAVDMWHLDYVRIERKGPPVIITKNNQGVGIVFEDIAFSGIPKPILKNYTSMPWNHFQGNEFSELRNDIEISLQNHFPATNNVSDSKIILKEQKTNTKLLDYVLLNADQFNIPNARPLTYKNPIPSQSSVPPSTLWGNYLFAMQNNFKEKKELDFEMTYFWNISQEQAKIASVLRNDTVRYVTKFSNYFAYDDGTAESNLVAQNSGTEIAVRYRTNVGDTLRAVQFHFPFVNENVSQQLFNLKVWTDTLTKKPAYTAVLLRPFYVTQVADSLQGFTTYVLYDATGKKPAPLYIPKGRFFIGWQQVTSTATPIPVGLDKNNTEATRHIFYAVGGVWNPLPSNLNGALMIRPIFGSETPQNTATPTQEIALGDVMNIYPNPTTDYLKIDLKQGNFSDYSVSIFNAVGQLIRQEILSSRLDLEAVENGFYFLKIENKSSNQVFTHKLLIIKQ